jgi:DNA invertase Pin-like site-specific DNA recombinase
MSAKKLSNPIQRTVALCYVRKSWMRDETDQISPERQRSNIQAVCEANGWKPEWYEDAEGHKSGMHEQNRPGWLALKARLGDPDVVALVANDLARLHRKGWRIGDLLDFVEQHTIKLVLADPRRHIDFSSPYGRMFAQLSAIFDEWYATDISERWKSSIAHRKSKGITVGLPPFGTKRDRQTGFLIPSGEGAWLMPDGTWVAGKVGEAPPVKEALWRGYFQCAERMLSMYADEKGRESICRRLQEEGWAFRDRKGQPVPIEVDDVRRITSNWAEYGGYVSEKRAVERHPVEYSPEKIIAKLKPERAVIDVDLLARVGRSRQKRALRKHPTDSVNRNAQSVPLSGITYCSHCEQMAQKHNNPRLRSRLWGRLGKFYRHKPGMGCGCTTTQVQREVYETDFLRLVTLLEVRPEQLDEMVLLAAQFSPTLDEEKDVETQRTEAIALCQRRIQAAIDLYGEGRLSREEYLRRIERNEREIASWQARTTETEKVAMELAMSVHAIDTIIRLWHVSSDEDKQGMARHLFEYVLFDLDRQEIVDFRLKPWADQFFVLRTAIYVDEKQNDHQTDDRRIAPTRFELVSSP